MTAKEYLENIRALDLLIESRLRQEQEIRAMLTATQAHLGNGMPRTASPNPDKIGDLVAELIDLQSEMNADIDRFVDMKKEIAEAVKRLGINERTFIESYYFGHQSMSAIGRKLGYCRHSIYNLRDHAVAALDEELKKLCTNCTP